MNGAAEKPERESEVVREAPWSWRELLTFEDWWANWLGLGLLATFLSLACIDPLWTNAPKDAPAKPQRWKTSPAEAIPNVQVAGGMGVVLLGACAAFGFGTWMMGTRLVHFLPAFAGLFLLATFAFLLARQEVIEYYNIEFAIWALFVGLVISNTLGTPSWIKPALRTEFYIKTGLVIYGAAILLDKLLAFALPGVCISWLVTPVVLISTYIIGQRWIGIESRSLTMTLSADMSVCGVSAAIATAAACRATKEELSLAIGISLSFTAIMMVAMPVVVGLIGLDPVVGGAWIGGTIDATGAVVVAGAALGDSAKNAAFTIKMVQNTLIGVIAFAVAVYWVRVVERGEGRPTVGPSEIWRRLPKFILGFLLASLAFTVINASGDMGREIVKHVDWLAKPAREWFFCLAFVSIGLETDFRLLAQHLRGGKPILLYVIGQSINLILTLTMAILMLQIVFPEARRAFDQ